MARENTMKRKISIVITAVLLTLGGASFVPPSACGETSPPNGGAKQNRPSPPLPRPGIVKPVLTVVPREINLGTVRPGETVNGMFTLKNLGVGRLRWSTAGPEGWALQENEQLTSDMGEIPEYLRVTLKSLGEITAEGNVKTKRTLYPFQLILEASAGTIVCRKNLTPGAYREVIKVTSNGGMRSIFLTFKAVEKEAKPLIEVEPLRADFGIVAAGRQVTKQVRLTNRGKESLTWQAAVPGARRAEIGLPTRTGRYLSFLNEETKGRGGYVPPLHLKDMLELSGHVAEDSGYPSFSGVNGTMKYRFRGTGLTLYLWNVPDGGNVAVYLDEQFVHVYNCYAEQREEVEFPVADILADGPHTLTLISDGGNVLIEGVRVHGQDRVRGNPGWIRVSPGTGMTTRETDYVNITLNTQNLGPGIYGDDVVFTSARGDAVVEVAVEVAAEQAPKAVEVYRFVKGSDYLFTTNPQAEANSLRVRGYRKQGIAFRLFSPDTPGTTPFYRWYNAQRGDHFYTYDHAVAGRSLPGYVFEGTIGNIATSRLTNTRELYRWLNPATGCHFYTTAQNGEDMAPKGYRFDGIAGYVK